MFRERDAAAVLENAGRDGPAYFGLPSSHWKRLRTNNVQKRTNREKKRESTALLVRLTGVVMCVHDEMRQVSRCFLEAKTNELYDEGRARGFDGPVDWTRLEAEARKMIESSLELADRIEAA